MRRVGGDEHTYSKQNSLGDIWQCLRSVGVGETVYSHASDEDGLREFAQ